MTDFVDGSSNTVELEKTEELTSSEYHLTINSRFDCMEHKCKRVGSKLHSSNGHVAVLYVCGYSSGWYNFLRFDHRIIEEVSKESFWEKYKLSEESQKNYLEFIQPILDEYRHSSEQAIIELVKDLVKPNSYLAFSELSIAFIPIGSKFRILHHECGGEFIDIFKPELYNLTA